MYKPFLYGNQFEAIPNMLRLFNHQTRLLQLPKNRTLNGEYKKSFSLSFFPFPSLHSKAIFPASSFLLPPEKRKIDKIGRKKIVLLFFIFFYSPFSHSLLFSPSFLSFFNCRSNCYCCCYLGCGTFVVKLKAQMVLINREI